MDPQTLDGMDNFDSTTDSVCAFSSCGFLDSWDISSGSLRRSSHIAASKSRSGWTTSLTTAFVVDRIRAFAAVAPDDRRSLIVVPLGTLSGELQCSLPEPATSIAISSNGLYIAIGSASGHVYIWSTTTGAMLSTFRPHLRQIDVLAFTDDNAFLCTGGQDAVANAYAFADCTQGSSRSFEPVPVSRWTDHSLSITCMTALPAGTRLLTGSADRTVRLFSIGCPTALFTFQLGSGLSAVVADPGQAFFCAATVDGRVHRCRLVHSAASLAEGAKLVESMEGKHTSPVTSMALSASCAILASAGDDGVVKLWDLRSRQCLHTLRQAASGTPRTHYRYVFFKSAVVNVAMQPDADAIASKVTLVERLGKSVNVVTRLSTAPMPAGSRSNRQQRPFQDDDVVPAGDVVAVLTSKLSAQADEIEALQRDRDRWAKVACDLFRLCKHDIEAMDCQYD